MHYGFIYKSVYVLARRDGTVVQDLGHDDSFGWNDDNEAIDPEAAKAAVGLLAGAYRT